MNNNKNFIEVIIFLEYLSFIVFAVFFSLFFANVVMFSTRESDYLDYKYDRDFIVKEIEEISNNDNISQEEHKKVYEAANKFNYNLKIYKKDHSHFNILYTNKQIMEMEEISLNGFSIYKK